MVEILIPNPRPRSIIIVSLFLALQSISSLSLATFIFVLGIITVRNAAADHKPTAAALTTAFAVVGSGLFLIIGLFALFLAWGMWRQKGWAFWGSAILEGLSLFLSLAFLCGGNIWLVLYEGVLPVVILVYLCANRQVQAISRR